ncbi:MAG: FtsX-like permease family protein [Pseudomonadota bacterium]
MSWLRLAIANLNVSRLTSIVNILLMALGTASIVALLLFGAQFSDTMSRDAKGIDLVIGAKGSPLQLVLATVYHADAPTGNIPLEAATRWGEDRRVAEAIPLALGDSFRGYRIVGTTPEYANIYDASMSAGDWWDAPLEAVIGSAAAATSGLSVGASFESAHGLGEGGHEHEMEPYRVVGVLEPTGSVLDRLILTSVESVWLLHDEEHGHDDHGEEEHEGAHEHDEGDHDEHEHHHEEHEGPDEHDEHDHDEHEHDHEEHDHEEHDHEEHDHEDREITAMLIQYRSPTAAITFPRQVNADSALVAAAPAIEVTRVLRLVGAGLDGLRTFAWLLIVSAGLSIFAALYGSLRARRGDIAMLRCLGATRVEVLIALLLEGLLLTVMGILIGFLTAHFAVEFMGQWLAATRGVTITGFTWLAVEWGVIGGLLAVGVLASVIPALQAYRTDVAKTLSESS